MVSVCLMYFYTGILLYQILYFTSFRGDNQFSDDNNRVTEGGVTGEWPQDGKPAVGVGGPITACGGPRVGGPTSRIIHHQSQRTAPGESRWTWTADAGQNIWGKMKHCSPTEYYASVKDKSFFIKIKVNFSVQHSLNLYFH